MTARWWASLASPIGPLVAVADAEGALVSLGTAPPAGGPPTVATAPPTKRPGAIGASPSPGGPAAGSDGAIPSLATLAQLQRDDAPFRALAIQLERYFQRDPTPFDLPLAPAGTPFQKRVWDALVRIPFGHTRSYGELAAALGDPNLTRAVGRANGANPLAIVVPCHRVIGADGSLVGYAGGLPMKRALLVLEGVLLF